MTEHPLLDLTGSVLMELTATGLLIAVFLRESVSFFSLPAAGAGLFLIGLFDRLITRKSISLGKYILLNLIPGGMFLAALFYTTEFLPESTGIMEFVFYFAVTGGVLLRRVYLGTAGMQEMSRIVRVDLLVVIFILVRVWYHFAHSRQATVLSLLSLGALALAVLTLTLERLRDSDSEKGPGTPVAVMAPFAVLFTVLLGGAVIFGERVSGVIMTAVLFAINMVRRGIAFLAGLVFKFLLWIISLLPDAEPMELDYKQPTVLEKLVEEEVTADSVVPVALLIALGVLALYVLLRAAFGILLTRTGGKKVTAKNERRKSHLKEAFRALLSRLGEVFRYLGLLLFYRNSVPGLLARAEWFGRRRLRPRRRGETLREFLARLEDQYHMGEASGMLSDYAERYYYSGKKPFLNREDIRKMKKAYPLF